MRAACLRQFSLQNSSFGRKEGAKQTALILMKNYHFNKTPLHCRSFETLLIKIKGTKLKYCEKTHDFELIKTKNYMRCILPGHQSVQELECQDHQNGRSTQESSAAPPVHFHMELLKIFINA